MLARARINYAAGPDTIVSRFQRIVSRRGDDIALIIPNGERLTCAQLDRRAAAIAARLAEWSVSTEEIVGVYLPRGVNYVATLLAVLRVGGAYLPIDPLQSSQRIAAVAAKARCTKVVVESSGTGTAAIARLFPQVLALAADVDAHALPGPLPCSFQPPTSANLAYVIATSGSTGEPKPVGVPHGAVINRLNWLWREYPYKRSDMCIFQSAVAYVDAVWEVFAPLLEGVPLVVYPAGEAFDIELMASLFDRYKVTRGMTLPSVLSAIIDFKRTQPDAFTSVDHWQVSGEALDSHVAAEFASTFPSAVFLDRYAATEMTVAFHQDHSHDRSRRLNSDSYYLTDNTSLYVLDEALEPVPRGAKGEIYVGGNGLARGYITAPGTTAAKYLPDPFSGRPGARMYRTGDLATVDANGRLTVCDRNDRLVKISGYRVELGEIDHVAMTSGLVKNAYSVFDRTDGRDVLALFVEGHEGAAGPDPTEALRTRLASMLPRYMQPRLIRSLPMLPRTLNGKLDISALKALIGTHCAALATRTEVQSIWCDVLGLDALPEQGGFYELGGTSLLANKLVARLRRLTGRRIPLRLIVRCKSVYDLERELAALASVTADRRENSAGPTTVEQLLDSTPRQPPLPR
jgi:amino acid adenylation domain-containing protein